jgi:cytidylate kinase
VTTESFVGLGLTATNILASVFIYLTSASNKRTTERFEANEQAMKDGLSEVKSLIKAGDDAEERRRTEALRDLDARTSQSISGLRAEIMGRFDDLKSNILTAITSRASQ